MILDWESNSFGFFMVRVDVGFMYAVASSCGLEGKAKNSCEKNEIGEPPQKAKGCTEINSRVTSNYTSSFIQFVRPLI
ncbi:hypothetical protein N178_23085 [Priestia aryabhattai B8W22]|nr:hypothetical protein N178_23085 [Priestia aryabhattai B8W22]